MTEDYQDNLCHVCRSGDLQLFPDYAEVYRVTSDARPWKPGGELAICPQCSLVQKPFNAVWRKDAEEVYAGYTLYHQSINKTEQKIRSAEGFHARSDSLFNWMHSQVPLDGIRTMLDFGCGNGATLKSLSKLFPGCDLYGYDPNVKDPDEFSSIPNVKTVFSDLKQNSEKFDLITIIHVLEHIPDPQKTLDAVKERLHPDGKLLIQVPYFIENPFDLTIADHCSHFTGETLIKIVEDCGFRIEQVSSEVLKREITLLAAPGQDDKNYCSEIPDPADPKGVVNSHIHWLKRVAAEAKDISSKPFGVFGTSIASAWISSMMSGAIQFYVDEDESRVGRDFMGRPTYLPRDVPKGSTVYVPLGPDIANQIQQRLNGTLAKYVAVPPL